MNLIKTTKTKTMLKNLSVLILTIIISSAAYSQCTPDPKYTKPGFYTSAGENKLPDAEINVAYDEVITAVVFKDTTIVGVGTYNLDSIVVLRVTGLPTGIVHSMPTNTFLGGTSGCIRLLGKTTGSPGPKTAKIDVVLYLQGLGAQNRTEEFIMNVNWPLSSENKTLNAQKVKVIPNPVKGETTFYLNNQTIGEVTLTIHNLLGEKVFDIIHYAEDINSKIEFDASNLPSGIYTYTLSSTDSKKVGRLVISEN